MRARTRPRSEATRRRLLDAALALFRSRGFDAATMRDVARAAGMSLGAAYYYFPSKEAIVMAWYAEAQEAHAARARAALAGARGLRERLAAVVHTRLDAVRRERKLLGALFRSVGDPEHPLSVFAPETHALREQSIALFDEALAGAEPAVPAEARPALAKLAWLGLLAVLLYFIHDRSRDEKRTRRLVDGALDLVAPLAPLVALPAARPLLARLTALVDSAR